jgi:hypothetical protein
VYPFRGGVGGEFGGDPSRGQHHRMQTDLGGLVVHEVREGDQLGVGGRERAADAFERSPTTSRSSSR